MYSKAECEYPLCVTDIAIGGMKENNMSYSFESRVRFSEIGENGCLDLPGVLDYFQDCCTFESEKTGLGMEVLKVQKRAWVLSAWQVVVKRYPKLGENIKVITIPYGFRGFIGMRNFILETAGGEKLAWANSYWSFINTETGVPEKLTPTDTEPMIWEINRYGLRTEEDRTSKGTGEAEDFCSAEASSGYQPSCKQLSVYPDGG